MDSKVRGVTVSSTSKLKLNIIICLTLSVLAYSGPIWSGGTLPADSATAAFGGTIAEGTTVQVPDGGFVLLDDQPADGMMDHAGSLIRLGQARTKYPSITGSGYTVAILDTGVDYTHPALAGRYVGGYDYVNGDGDPNDDNGHGTHVCGISASDDATYNGLAPQAGYAVLKVLDASGSGTFTQVENALQWVIDNRATHNIVAVNMSLGTAYTYNIPQTGQIADELQTLKNAGVFTAVSSGNGWYSHQPNQGVAYPAADACAVAVGDVWTANFGGIGWTSGGRDWTTAPDRVVSHCDRSTTMLDVFAPGALVTSCAYNWEGGNSDFVQKGGTSMAAPAVAGLAILIREAIEENWDPADWPTGAGWQDTILQIMQDYGVTINDGDDEDDNVINLNADFQRIDVLGALDYVVPEPATMFLLVLGGTGVLIRRRRK